MGAVLLHFDDEQATAGQLARAAGLAAVCVQRHRFPDGELKLTLPPIVPERVILFRTLDRPNEKLVELLLTVQTARQLGARHITLVAPYLAYMRQDIAFHPGEVVSQRVIGSFLAGLFDAVVTVDPHLHRIATLQEAIPVMRAVVVSGAPLLADLIAMRRPGALLMGPDEESAQWIAQAAAGHGFDYAVCHKLRRGDRDVRVVLPDLSVAGRAVVLLDDVASTGHTVARAAEALLSAGAVSVDVAVTHALFADDALAVMKHAGIGEVWSTDCIVHPTNAISMASALAAALS
jgi:ribose-phosphate pyrophosphokinase